MLSKFTIIRTIFLIILSLQMKIRFIKREPKDVNIHSLDKHYKFSSFKCIRNLLYKFCSLINRICMSHVISNGTEHEICLKNLNHFLLIVPYFTVHLIQSKIKKINNGYFVLICFSLQHLE
jgi:hypothetical protein